MTRKFTGKCGAAIRTMIAPAVAMGVVALGLAVPSVFADQWNQLTKVTFNQPVEIPGQVLPAGTYWFKLLDSSSDRDIVQIYNSNQSKQVALVMAIPDYRTRPTGKTVLTFKERASDAPQAVKAWFYPGQNFGQEFVYPKTRATQLAKINNEPVLSMPANEEANTKRPASENQASAKAMRQSELKAEQPSGEEVESATIIQTPPQLLAQNNPPAQPNNNVNNNAGNNNAGNNNAAPASNQHLPSTASNLPLMGLSGLMFLSFGSVLTLLRRSLN